MRVAAMSASYRFIPTHVGNSANVRFLMTLQPVHPHARGEQLNGLACTMTAGGSSPRTWGTVPALQCVGTDCRFIPTHVGNS